MAVVDDVGARFSGQATFNRYIQMQMCIFGQCRLRIPSHRDDRIAIVLHERNQPQNLIRLTGIGNRQYDVVRRDHPQIAMISLPRMQEE